MRFLLYAFAIVLLIGGVQVVDYLTTRPYFESEGVDRVVTLDVINRFEAGDTIEIGGRTVVLEHVPAALVTTHILLYLAFWLIAALLLWTRPHDPLVRLLAFTILALTAGNFFRPITDMPLDTTRGMLLQQICALGRFLGPALLVNFALVFPRRTLPPKAVTRIRAFAFGIPFALYLVEQYVLLRGARYLLYDGVLATIRYWDIRFWVFIAAWAACGALLLGAYKQLPEKRERDQLKWIMWSVLFAACADAVIVAIALYGAG
ncbi:MAG: hypothetical protein ACT443_12260, partial [Gemmatimonadota bacterium]